MHTSNPSEFIFERLVPSSKVGVKVLLYIYIFFFNSY